MVSAARDEHVAGAPTCCRRLACAHCSRRGTAGGDAEHHVQTCTHELAASCSRREDVRAAVDRLVAAVSQLRGALMDGSRRRERHDAAAVERLLETLQEQLLPELRTNGLL